MSKNCGQQREQVTVLLFGNYAEQQLLSIGNIISGKLENAV
ncbi:MAG: hypothetical protein QF886_12445 [Planctomycetota bacterium]|jgi:hypothetical protein|nr:hypothetical protein [Planctomycetota bacterium]